MTQVMSAAVGRDGGGLADVRGQPGPGRWAAGGGQDHVVLAVDDGDPGGVEFVAGPGGQAERTPEGMRSSRMAAAVS